MDKLEELLGKSKYRNLKQTHNIFHGERISSPLDQKKEIDGNHCIDQYQHGGHQIVSPPSQFDCCLAVEEYSDGYLPVTKGSHQLMTTPQVDCQLALDRSKHGYLPVTNIPQADCQIEVNDEIKGYLLVTNKGSRQPVTTPQVDCQLAVDFEEYSHLSVRRNNRCQLASTHKVAKGQPSVINFGCLITDVSKVDCLSLVEENRECHQPGITKGSWSKSHQVIGLSLKSEVPSELSTHQADCREFDIYSNTVLNWWPKDVSSIISSIITPD
jgi:hypothetical protein